MNYLNVIQILKSMQDNTRYIKLLSSINRIENNKKNTPNN